MTVKFLFAWFHKIFLMLENKGYPVLLCVLRTYIHIFMSYMPNKKCEKCILSSLNHVIIFNPATKNEIYCYTIIHPDNSS